MKSGKQHDVKAQFGAKNKALTAAPLVLALAIVLSVMIMATSGYVLYRGQEQAGEGAINRELSTVGQLKAGQIAEWRLDMTARVNSVRNSPLFNQNATELISTPSDSTLRGIVSSELASLQKTYLFQDIRLVDVTGNILAGLDGTPDDLPENIALDLSSALSSHQTIWSDFYFSRANSSPQIDIIAPLYSEQNDSESAAGVLIFTINPFQALYPLIQSWPTTSPTADTMLVALESNQAVLLNELRQQQGTALKLKIPLNHENDPAAAVVKGARGIFSGTDYRGVTVLANLQPIEISPWFLVVKIDRAEIFAGRNLAETWVVGAGMGVFIVLIGILWMVRQHRQDRLYQSLYREHLEEKTRISHLEYMVKYANDIILICDEQKRIMQVNEHALEIYGYASNELKGASLLSLFTQDTVIAFQSQLNKIGEMGAVTAEVSFKRKNAGAIPVEIAARLFKINDQTFLQAIIRDISERKAKEEEIHILNSSLEARVQERTSELENANKELESFAYSVSHDLRAPLRGIDGWSQVLMEDYKDKLGEKGFQILGRIRSETQRMGQLIDDMLKFSRDTRGELNRQEVDLTAVVQTITARLQQANPNRQIKFVVQQGLKTQGDAHLLEMALSNLLENSVKFTSKIPQALILFGEVNKDGKHAFFVHDNGVGFDMAYAQKLFKVFQRLHKGSDYPGTGIGLATVQRIIHRHGGKIWAEAQTDHGATFYFTLKEAA